MGVYYDAYRKENPNEVAYRGRGDICFFEYYRHVARLSKLVVYVLKEWHDKEYDGRGQYGIQMFGDEKQVSKFADGLLKAGLQFTFNPDAMCSMRRGADAPAYSYTIPCTTQSNMAVMILMNVIRYQYESPFQDIAEKFVKLCDDKESKVNHFNRLSMAHIEAAESIHNYQPERGSLIRMLAESEVENLLTEKVIRHAVNENIPTIRPNPAALRTSGVRQLIHDGKATQAFQKYLGIEFTAH